MGLVEGSKRKDAKGAKIAKVFWVHRRDAEVAEVFVDWVGKVVRSRGHGDAMPLRVG